MSLIKVIIFDCDGVMFDSRDANNAYYNHLLHHFDLPKMSRDQRLFANSHTVSETLLFLMNNRKLLVDLENYRKRINYNPFIELMTIEPKLEFILKKLRTKFKIAIATNRTNTIHKILKKHKITSFFDFVICSKNVILPKPYPEMLNKVLNYFEVDPIETIYIGDSKLDEQASKLAKIPFISYRNKNLKAIKHINLLSELEMVLDL